MTATFKATVAVFTILMVLHIGSSALTSAHPPDPEMLQYLEQVFEDAKSMNRPLVLGELNLLPRGKDGFANTVRCFFDTNQSMSDDFRILQFNLSSLSASDKIASIQLVLKQSSSTTSSYVTQLYEIKGGSIKEIDLLDSGEYSGQWHTLQVQNIKDSINADSLRRNYHLALSITTENGESIGVQDILRTIKPMLLAYTNSLDWLGKGVKLEIERKEAERMEAERREEKKEDEASLVGEESWQTMQESKRSTDLGVLTPAARTLDGISGLSCRKQATSSVLNLRLWETYTMTEPDQLNFTFCYGTCTSPLQVGLTHLYSNHAKLMALIAPARERVSPCCTPREMTTIPVIYQSTVTYAFVMTSFPVVVSCRCM